MKSTDKERESQRPQCTFLMLQISQSIIIINNTEVHQESVCKKAIISNHELFSLRSNNDELIFLARIDSTENQEWSVSSAAHWSVKAGPIITKQFFW